MKAEYRNQLDYNGLDKIKETFVTPTKWYFDMAEFGSMTKCIPIPRSMLILYKTKGSEYIHHLRLIIEKLRYFDNSHGNFNPS